jgi:serine/threonine protein kinase/Tol biopolymer transport system component
MRVNDSDGWIGRYRLIRNIGKGGMGEVYLAADSKLERNIAIKVLSTDFASDADRMARFIREAITTSSLNHPNIVTIYEINDDGPIPFIAMEYVEGITLGSRLKSSSLTPEETLDIAVQIATALSAAHDAKVVHRDIKPDNVILRPDGLVKVLDFGLAKQVETHTSADFEAQTIQNVQTHPGLIMGTVAYMSPEQARGKNVDARSDIFSFGSLLYQMATGRMPFIGENDLDVVGSILHKEPRPLSQFARPIPQGLDIVVKRALRKDRDERYQTMRELLADLKDIRETLILTNRSESNGNAFSGQRSSPDRGLPTEQLNAAAFAETDEIAGNPLTISSVLLTEIKTHPIIAGGAAAALIVIAISAGLFTRQIAAVFRGPERFEKMRLDKLTFTGNILQEQAALSPDGKYFAYTIADGGRYSLWVRQVKGETSVNILQPGQHRIRDLTFSPDGTRIYYTSSDGEGPPAIFQIPALGGQSRKVINDAQGPLSFTRDGNSITFIRNDIEIHQAAIDGKDEGKEGSIMARAPEGQIFLRTAVSPDGQLIAAQTFASKNGFDHQWVINLKTGDWRELNPQSWIKLNGLAWMPDNRLLIAGRDTETQNSQIWLIDPETDERRRVTNDLSLYAGLSLSADGRTIISTQFDTMSSVSVSGIGDGAKPVEVTEKAGNYIGRSGIALMPDGSVIYTVRNKGAFDIWIVSPDRSVNRQLTFGSAENSNFSPAATPDGQFIVFVSTRGGPPGIWRMRPDGSDVVELTGEPGAKGDPIVTPDGQWVIYYTAYENGGTGTLRKVSINGGPSIQLTQEPSDSPAISPDGRFIAFDYGPTKEDSNIRVAIITADGGRRIRMLDSVPLVRSRNIRWTADGRGLYYINTESGVGNIWMQPIDGSPPRQITNFSSDRIFRFDYSPSAGKMAFTRGIESSDVVLISDFN